MYKNNLHSIAYYFAHFNVSPSNNDLLLRSKNKNDPNYIENC